MSTKTEPGAGAPKSSTGAPKSTTEVKPKPTAPKPTAPAPRLKIADLLARKLELDAELEPINAALGILAGVSATPPRGRPASPTMRIAGIDAGTYAVLEVVAACTGAASTAQAIIDGHPEVARSARQRLTAALKRGYLASGGADPASGLMVYRLTKKFFSLRSRLRGEQHSG